MHFGQSYLLNERNAVMLGDAKVLLKSFLLEWGECFEYFIQFKAWIGCSYFLAE